MSTDDIDMRLPFFAVALAMHRTLGGEGLGWAWAEGRRPGVHLGYALDECSARVVVLGGPRQGRPWSGGCARARIFFRGEEIERLREVTIRVLFAGADFAEKNADVFRAFFRAYRKAVDFMFDNREETVRIWISHAKLALPEATVMRAYDFYPRGSLAFRPVSGARTAVENAVRFGFLKQPLTQAELERLIDLRYVP